ncbi:hypothetical protein A2Y83_01285, partial [Candidatus Falkowbacteria bacterium RBG_13_39_14]
MTQNDALEILKMGYNVFLTGPAGSGKTFVLNKFIRYLKENIVPVAVTASTGLAATHLGGTTIHSWSGLGINEELDKKTLKKIVKKGKLRNRILKTAVLIIDEISMLGAAQLDAVDMIVREIRQNDMAFGGMQIIFCGDFFQLPPVKKAGNGNNVFAYQADAWHEADIKACYLEEQHRQKDDSLIKILNDIRRNSISEESMRLVASCRNKAAGASRPAKLFTHNEDVDRTNDEELGKIFEKPYAYNMRFGGKEKFVEFLKKSCLAPERLVLKKGAQVMFIKNNFEEGYVNGTMGKVVGFCEETKFPVVRTFCGKEIAAFPEVWIYEEDGEEIAKIKQIPLRLAWAITVHKSQGMSLDAAEINLGKSFEYGMGYVAISRVRSLDGLHIAGINRMAFEVHKESRHMDEEFIKQSESALCEMRAMGESEIRKRQERFL